MIGVSHSVLVIAFVPKVSPLLPLVRRAIMVEGVGKYHGGIPGLCILSGVLLSWAFQKENSFRMVVTRLGQDFGKAVS